jgi:hypothetical protein
MTPTRRIIAALATQEIRGFTLLTGLKATFRIVAMSD